MRPSPEERFCEKGFGVRVAVLTALLVITLVWAYQIGSDRIVKARAARKTTIDAITTATPNGGLRLVKSPLPLSDNVLVRVVWPQSPGLPVCPLPR